MKEGYIPISRKLFESLWWLEEREFSKAEAWLDMIQSARFEASSTKMLLGCKVIEIGRGEFPATIRFLAKRWGWNKNRVDRFLKLLMSENMITTRTASGTSQTIIKLCNYDDYNPTLEEMGQKRDKVGTDLGQQRDNAGTKNNKGNKDNKGKREGGESGDSTTPAPSPDFVKFQKWIADNAPTVVQMRYPFTEEEFMRLKTDFGSKYMQHLILQMHNYKPLLKKCQSANLTFRRWAERDKTSDADNGKKLTPRTDAEGQALLERLKNN